MTKNELKEKIKYPPRFTIEDTMCGLAIFDNQGIDDYYHINELEDMEALVNFLNNRENITIDLLEENRRLRHLVLQLQSKLDAMPNLGDLQQEIIDRLTLSDDFFKDKECRCIKTNIQLESKVNKDD